MKRIIKPGKMKVITCPRCECVFSYEEEDVKEVRTGMQEYEDRVTCPQCEYEMNTDTPSNVQQYLGNIRW